MEPADVTFNKITSVASSQYFVPIWQRPYSWDTQEWNDLWKDIKNLDEITANGEQHAHFIGTMVLRNTVNKVGMDLEYAIVDGQQRFTTLLIMCSAIRDIAEKTGDQTLADKINNGFLFFPSEDGDLKPRLLLQDKDNVEFKNLINKSHGSLSKDVNISRAYNYFYKELDKERDKLKRIFSLIGGLKLITISLNDSDDPHRIFETLNSRGKDLTQADLIRNFFIMRMPSIKDQEQIYSDFWRPLEKLFEEKKASDLEDNLEAFFTDYVAMLKRTAVKQDLVYFTIKEHYGITKSKAEMIGEIEKLYSYAKVYAKMLFPDREEDEQIGLKLQNLNRSGVYTYYPFLLKLLYHYHVEKSMEKNDLLNTLTSLESFIFRRIYCRIPPNSLNKYFPTLCDIESPNVNEKLTKKLAEGRYSFEWPDLYAFIQGISEFQVYKRNKEVAKLTLELLEKKHAMYEPLDFSKLEIEHIMPETLDDKWASYLGSNAEQIHENYLHVMGNLTLITRSPNASISQKLFAKKKEEWYRHSGVKLTGELVRNFENWKKEDIERRSFLLMPTLSIVWPHPSDKKIFEKIFESNEES